MADSILVEIELATALVVAIFAVVVVWLFVRRRRISGAGPTVLGALRAPCFSQWRLGLVRFDEAQLQWFLLVGWTTRPSNCWDRHQLEFPAPQPMRGGLPGLSDAVQLVGTAEGQPIELALPRPGSMTLRVWLESSPPGYNVDVA